MLVFVCAQALCTEQVKMNRLLKTMEADPSFGGEGRRADTPSIPLLTVAIQGKRSSQGGGVCVFSNARHPFTTGWLPLSCSGNPGVNGVFYRGANRTYFINSASGESTYAAPADCGHCL